MRCRIAEEQFYIAWPFLVLTSGRRGLPFLVAVCVAVSVTARALGLHCGLLLARCDGFALGGLLAALGVSGIAPCLASCAASVVGLVLLTAEVIKHGFPPLDYLHTNLTWSILAVNLLAFATVAVVVRYQGHRSLALLRARPLVYLGTISYGIYLYHCIILVLLFRLGDDGQRSYIAVRTLVVICATLAVATLSWYLVEKPILRLKDRIPYRALVRTKNRVPRPGPLMYWRGSRRA